MCEVEETLLEALEGCRVCEKRYRCVLAYMLTKLADEFVEVMATVDGLEDVARELHDAVYGREPKDFV